MQYQEKYQVEFSDCDENRRLKLPAMVDLMMRVSEHQLDRGGAGTDDLVKRGLGWVVTQYHFEIKSLPRALENIILTTEASGYNRFFEYRDFGIEDAQGTEMIHATSQWVLFDLQKRHLVPSDLKMMQAFQVPLLKHMPRFPRLRPLKEYEHQRRYRVRYDDLDTNHHLTNSHYFNWFIDMLDRDFLKSHVAQVIDLKFDQELNYGELPFSCVTVKKEGPDLISYHEIKDQAGQEKTLCVIKWRKL